MSTASQQPGFVLVKTQMSENIGAACRSMRCFGFERLALVQPQCDPCDDGAEALAAGQEALAIAEAATRSAQLEEALAPFRTSVGLTRRAGRTRLLDGSIAQVVDQLQRVEGLQLSEVAFVFGPEATGLSNDDIKRCDLLASIPTDPIHGSLNLAHAVTCVCYELTRMAPTVEDAPDETLREVIAPLDLCSDDVPLAEAQRRAHDALMAYFDAIDFYTVPPREILSLRMAQMMRRSLLTPRDLLLVEQVVRKLLHTWMASET